MNMKTSRATRAPIFLLALPLLGALACGSSASLEAPRSRPNLILVTIDTLRRDALGIYGNDGGHSPNLDAFGKSSVIFERAVTPMGTTLPAHASLFTALYPRAHQVRWNGGALSEEHETLAEVLAAEGYETAAFVSFPLMFTEGRLARGFATWDGARGTPDELKVPGDQVTRRALEWLRSAPAEPFFLWAHYTETHSPYAPTAYSKETLSQLGYDGPLAGVVSAAHIMELGQSEERSEGVMRALGVVYDAAVREADRVVGALLRELEGDLGARSVIVLTSDHGQALGEHGDFLHGFLLWEEVIAIPLIVRVPGGRPARVSTLVGLVDVASTLLELLDVPGESIESGDGRSLARALRGEPLPSRTYFAEVRSAGSRRFATDRDASGVAAYLGERKLVRRGATLQLFELAVDPTESSPLRDGELTPEERALADRLEEYYESPAPAGDEPGEDLVERLRALGYVR